MFSEIQVSLAKSFINSASHYIKENRPSPKTAIIGAVAAVAAYIFINYLTSSVTSRSSGSTIQHDRKDLEAINTIENEKVKKIFENFYKLNNNTVLNKDLELQKRPTRLAAILNHCGMKLGLSDQFENIRAENVTKEIEKFISENKLQFCLMKKVEAYWTPATILQSFEIRTGKQCDKAREILKKTESVDIGEWIKFSDDQSHYFEFENVMGEILHAEKMANLSSVAAKDLLLKLAMVQGQKVDREQTKTSPTILPFQTDPYKNAYMQYSSIHYNNGDLENAKKMISLAVESTDIKTDHWDKKLPNNYFEFFGETCIEFANKYKDSDLALSNKFLIAAKDYILKNEPSYIEALSDALDAVGLSPEAKDCRQKGIHHYLIKIGTKNFAFNVQLYPSHFISLMNLYVKVEGYSEIRVLGKELFPDNQDDDLGLTLNQKQIWDVYQSHLRTINIATTLNALEKNTF